MAVRPARGQRAQAPLFEMEERAFVLDPWRADAQDRAGFMLVLRLSHQTFQVIAKAFTVED